MKVTDSVKFTKVMDLIPVAIRSFRTASQSTRRGRRGRRGRIDDRRKTCHGAKFRSTFHKLLATF